VTLPLQYVIPFWRLSHNLQIDQWDQQLSAVFQAYFCPRRAQAAGKLRQALWEAHDSAGHSGGRLAAHADGLPQRQFNNVPQRRGSAAGSGMMASGRPPV
jgi:hypothetical protein